MLLFKGCLTPCRAGWVCGAIVRMAISKGQPMKSKEKSCSITTTSRHKFHLKTFVIEPESLLRETSLLRYVMARKYCINKFRNYRKRN